MQVSMEKNGEISGLLNKDQRIKVVVHIIVNSAEVTSNLDVRMI